MKVRMFLSFCFTNKPKHVESTWEFKVLNKCILTLWGRKKKSMCGLWDAEKADQESQGWRPHERPQGHWGNVEFVCDRG